MATGAPEGRHTLIPRIFAADAAGLVEFLRTVFEAKGEFAGDRPAEMQIGDSILMVSGTEARPAMPACLYVYVPDADATYRRAMEAGAESMEAPLNTPYGDRRAMIGDRWGNTWQIATHR